MSKVSLIIKREFLSRVKKKTFILSTILFPVLYLALIFGTSYLGEKSKQSISLAVVDSSGMFANIPLNKMGNEDMTLRVSFIPNTQYKTIGEKYQDLGFDGYVVIPVIADWQTGKHEVKVISDKKFGTSTESNISNRLNGYWSQVKNEHLGLDAEKINILQNSLLTIKAENTKGEDSNGKTASVIGFVLGFLIYFILLLYGSQVMMGVMEEKTNRIAEVIVSSVEPFQLMLGKIIGISMVALFQFFLWIAFIFIIFNVTKSSGSGNESVSGILATVQGIFTSINIPLILGAFTFYLLGGFFFYASLFAAIGSAVNEDMREAQSLSFPVTMLIIFAIAMLPMVMNDPYGPVAVWGSIIPFTSPIIMLARIPFGVPSTVPYWQLIASMVSLVGGFLLSTWFTAKIYRTGILMYGKKPSWKEMISWAFRKN